MGLYPGANQRTKFREKNGVPLDFHFLAIRVTNYSEQQKKKAHSKPVGCWINHKKIKNIAKLISLCLLQHYLNIQDM